VRFLLVAAYPLGFRRIILLVLILMGTAIAQRQCYAGGGEIRVPPQHTSEAREGGRRRVRLHHKAPHRRTDHTPQRSRIRNTAHCAACRMPSASE